MTLSSLSSTDYPCLLELCDDLLDYCAPRDIGLSLPSLRADTFSMNLMERLQRVRKGGLDLRAGGGDPAAAGRHQQEPAGGGPAPILPHRLSPAGGAA